jgi:pullulanase
MTKAEDIQANLTFLNNLEANVVGYTIDNSPNGESATSLCIIYNANKAATTVTIPSGDWNVYVKGNQAGTEILETITGGQITVAPISTIVLVQENTEKTYLDDRTAKVSEKSAADASGTNKKGMTYLLVGIFSTAFILIATVVIYVRRQKKK